MIKLAHRQAASSPLSTELQRLAPGALERNLIRRTTYRQSKDVDGWIEGKTIPSNRNIFRIGEALNLSREKVAELHRMAELERSTRAVHRSSRQRHRIPIHLHLVGSKRE